MKTHDLSVPGDEVATSILSLAVLLQVGASADAAWRYLAESGDPTATAVVSERARGVELLPAIAGQAGPWAQVASAWEIASIVGAPLAEALRAIAESIQDAAATETEVRLALAEPAATARLMMWLPGAGLLLGFALGFDTFGVIFGSVIGGVCVALGLLLVVLSRRWTKRLIREAQQSDATGGLDAELIAIALSGSASIEKALRLVADTSSVRVNPETERVLSLSQSAGIPAIDLLRGSAAQQRRREKAQGRMRAAELATRLLIPLGVCTLPAFLLLAIAPLILSVLSATPIGLMQ